MAELNDVVSKAERNKYPTYESFVEANPIEQNFHTGRYGFARVLDCLDLNACTYYNEAAAENARRRRWEEIHSGKVTVKGAGNDGS